MSAIDDPGPLTGASALERSPGPIFFTTRWHVVLAATEDTPAGREALAHLCHGYWPPVYSFIRRKGYETADAQDPAAFPLGCPRWRTPSPVFASRLNALSNRNAGKIWRNCERA